MQLISNEDMARAREMDLLTYLTYYDPENLKHVSGNTYCTAEHDSLIINNGKWCWFSQGIGGKSALDYLINSFDLTTEYGETFHCLLVSVTYTNLSEKEQDITKRNIEFYLDNEEIKPCEYRSEFEPFFDEGNLFNDNNINPGRTKRGYIVYRIYKDYSKIDVVLNGITVSASRDAVKPLALPTPTETTQVAKETNND